MLTRKDAEEIGEELILVNERLSKLRERFDSHVEPCGSCGLKHARNLPEKKAVDAIDAAVARVEKVIECVGETIDRENSR